MSVYYQAFLDGRIKPDECRARPCKYLPAKTIHTVTRAALKHVKRREAGQRADVVAFERTKRYRRDLAAALAAAAKRRRDSRG